MSLGLVSERRHASGEPVRILVVEDDTKSARFVRKGLSEAGYVVDVAGDGEEGFWLASTDDYDLLILDILLPRRDGWWVLGRLRRSGNQTPVLCLTARASVHERVKGLELGADDYLVKPFSFSELLARVRSILRRGNLRQQTAFVIGGLEVDLVRHSVSREGRRLDLSPKEFSLLSLLVRRAGEVLSRTLIADQVWGMNFDCETNVVDVAVARLRRRVDDNFSKRLIHTVRGVGYVLEER